MKKSITLSLCTAALLLTLAGCSKVTSYYQVYQIKPSEDSYVVQDESKLANVTTDFEIIYNFFAENGDAGFWLKNNTDSVIFVDLNQTFFVLNGTSNEYYRARQWTSTKSSTLTVTNSETTKSKKKKSREAHKGSSETSTSASTYSERNIIAVAPHSSKHFSEYQIRNTMIELCNVKETPKKGKPEGASFTIDNSPIVFSNVVTLNVGTTGETTLVNDKFYVSEIINVHGDAMFDMVRAKDACGYEKSDKISVIRYSTPDRFYVTYKR